MYKLSHQWNVFHDIKFQNQSLLCSFSDVMKFWAVYDNLPKGTCLEFNSNYRYFKNDISPKSEDKQNIVGGQWIVRVSEENMDQVFLELLMAAVGNQFQEKDNINGIVLNSRGDHSRIGVWVNKKLEKTRQDISRFTKISEMEYRTHNLTENDLPLCKSGDKCFYKTRGTCKFRH